MSAGRPSLPAFLQSREVREAGLDDAIEGVLPQHVVEPDSPDAMAELLAAASREGVSTVLRGGGTKLAWGRAPRPVDLVVSTRRLNRVLAHAHGDLTATVEAGTAVRTLNQELARQRQWLPVDTPFDQATIGGLIATNDSGPLRHRHGTPRDLLIGIHLAMTDGHVVKAGGTVVKNVAGYDLGKLVSGSHGSLAAIVSATFKLAPLPGASKTVVAGFADADALAAAVSAISASQLEPTMFDVHVIAGAEPTRPTQSQRGGSSVLDPSTGSAGRVHLDARAGMNLPYRLLMQFASTPAAIEAQVDQLQRLLTADGFEVFTGTAEADIWHSQTRAIWAATGSIVRASWLPANLRATMSMLKELIGDGVAAIELAGRAGVGAGLIRIVADGPESVSATVRAIERLRARPDLIGHVVVRRAEPAVKRQLDVWGEPSGNAALLAAVKRAFDPAGILNAGRGPL